MMFHIPSVLLPQFVSTNIKSPHQKCKRANSESWIEERSDYLSQFQARAEMVTFLTRLAPQDPNSKPQTQCEKVIDIRSNNVSK